MRRIGRYELEQLLGEGASGAVHAAVLVGPGGLRKPVALKLLVRGAGTLRREARIGGLLRHRHLVDVYEVGEVDGTWFIAMERCDGALSDHLPLSPRAVVDVGLQVCEALQYAHEELGLVHLDLKPANLLVADGVVKVADLGIARAHGFEDDGRVRGTPVYMAPEQAAGGAVDARADLYALGVTLIELSTGAPPSPSTTLDFVDMLLGEVATEVAVPEWLAPAVERCLQDAPDERWPDMAALAQALRTLDTPGPTLRELLGTPEPEAPAETGTNLPPATEPLIGRTSELSVLLDLLQAPGIVTVKGTAGIGKTRLARDAARQWHDDTGGQVWFCDGVQARHAGALVASIAQTLQVPSDPRAPLGGVVNAVAGRGPVVLVLDNLEHIEAAAAVVDTLAEGAPQARLLVTSRTALGLSSERVVELGSLDAEAAAALVARRARERGVQVDTDAPALKELVAQLDGLPLALELAAGRMGVLSVEEVRDRIGLSLLRQGTSGRHATLAAALQWSWDLLSGAEQSTLAQLSVFVGGFGAEDAEAVVDVQGVAVIDLLDALSRRSMLATSDGRHRLLASVQAFAEEKLEGRDAELRHGRHFARLARERLERWFGGAGVRERQAAMVRDLPDLGAACLRAVERNDLPVATATCEGAWYAWITLSPGREMEALLEAVLGMDGLSTLQRCTHQAWLSSVMAHHGRVAEGRMALDEALALARDRGDASAEGTALAELGRHLMWYGSQAEAQEVLQAALDLALQLDDLQLQLHARIPRIIVELRLGSRDAGRAMGEAALELARAMGNTWQEGRIQTRLGVIGVMEGRAAEARERHQIALGIARRFGNRRVEAAGLANLGEALRQLGELPAARRLLEDSLELLKESGNRISMAINLGNLALILTDLGERQLARARFEEALALHRDLGARVNEAVALGNLGTLLLELGELDEAEAALRGAVAIHDEVGNQRYLVSILQALARLHQARGELEEARRVATRSVDVARGIGHGPGTAVALVELARLEEGAARGLEHLAEAEQLLADEDDPAFRAKLELARAELLHTLGRADGAAAALVRAESLVPAGHHGLGVRVQEVRALLTA